LRHGGASVANRDSSASDAGNTQRITMPYLQQIPQPRAIALGAALLLFGRSVGWSRANDCDLLVSGCTRIAEGAL